MGSAQISNYQVKPLNESGGVCACCGNASRSVWGFVNQGDVTVAVYWVHWTVGHLQDSGADIDLVLGRWGEGASPNDRSAISLVHREAAGEPPSVMVIDARSKFHDQELAAQLLKREDVIGTPLAPQVFALIDAIYTQDNRFF